MKTKLEMAFDVCYQEWRWWSPDGVALGSEQEWNFGRDPAVKTDEEEVLGKDDEGWKAGTGKILAILTDKYWEYACFLGLIKQIQAPIQLIYIRS